MKKKAIQFIAILAVLAVVLFGTARNAAAAEIRSGNVVEIPEGEVVADDLIVLAETVRINGTIQGDLISLASTTIIGPTGVVEGDVMAAGQLITIEGSVADDVRISGAVLSLGPQAQVGDDLFAMGFNLTDQAGAQVGGDLLFAGYQGELSGDVAGELRAAGNAIALNGKVGGDVEVEAGSADQGRLPFNPFVFIPGMPSFQIANPGFTIGPDAQIGGSLTYTAVQPAQIPAGAVSGETLHKEPVVTPQEAKERQPPTFQERAARWVARWMQANVARFMSLLITGLLLMWLWPKLGNHSTTVLQKRPWASLGIGVLVVFGIFVVAPLFLSVLVFIDIVFSLLSLGGLTGVLILSTLVIMLGLGLAYLLGVTLLARVIICILLGRLILGAFKSPAAMHRFWPFLLGLVVYSLVAAIPVLGWLGVFLASLFGTGALGLWLASLFGRMPEETELVEPAPVA